MSNLPKYICRKQLARICSVAERTVDSWRYRNQGPKYIKLATGTVRYPIEDVLHFLGEYQQKKTSDLPVGCHNNGETDDSPY